MTMYLPLTIDLNKDQLMNKEYGIDHINKLLEEELEHLKSLKSQKPRDSLPVIKTNAKSNEVEGLRDYKQRVEQTKSRGCMPTNNDIGDKKTYIGPFSEINHDFTRDYRVTGKGEVPFFKVNADRSSLSYRLPRLLDPKGPKIVNYAGNQLQTPVSQATHSRRNERTKRSSGKLVRSSGNLFKNDCFPSESSQDDITDSLKVQYCAIKARHSLEENDETQKYQKRVLANENKHATKTFHLACTRNSSRYQPIKTEETECSFCAAPVCIHSRCSQNQTLKSRQSNTRQSKATEKPFLPQIKTEVTNKKEEVRTECVKCRKRSEQAEQNKISLAITSSQRKREASNSLNRKTKSRPATKERKPAVQAKQEDATVVECAAYVHDDGTLSLLPGAFFLRNNDYNVWSRNGRTTSVKTSQQNISSNSSLPRLVQ